MQKNSFRYIYLFIFLFLVSCDNNIEFSKYESVANAAWKANESISFTFSIKDTISPKNLFINIRNNNDYPFSNLYVITSLSFPDGLEVIDTLQYEMADQNGHLLGRGSSIKENKLFYKSQKVFPMTGDYQFQIRQAMRKSGEIDPINYLEGIHEVGLSIEKIEQP